LGTSKRILTAAFALILVAAGRAADRATIITGADLADGSGAPLRRANVRFVNDRIVAVGDVTPQPGDALVDGRGLVVAPGFIDIHSHSDYLLLEDGDAQSKIRQGVTTEVLGEGRSVGPNLGQLPPRRVAGKSWTTIAGYFETLEKSGTSVNVAAP